MGTLSLQDADNTRSRSPRLQFVPGCVAIGENGYLLGSFWVAKMNCNCKGVQIMTSDSMPEQIGTTSVITTHLISNGTHECDGINGRPNIAFTIVALPLPCCPK
jgi:hypothetical protein